MLNTTRRRSLCNARSDAVRMGQEQPVLAIWLSCRLMLGSCAAGKAPLPFAAGIDMTLRTRVAAAAVALVCAAPFYVFGAQAPAVVGAATDIPGVVKSGSPIQRIVTGYKGLDDPIGLVDGSLVFSEPDARRLHRLTRRPTKRRCSLRTPMNRTA